MLNLNHSRLNARMDSCNSCKIKESRVNPLSLDSHHSCIIPYCRGLEGFSFPNVSTSKPYTHYCGEIVNLNANFMNKPFLYIFRIELVSSIDETAPSDYGGGTMFCIHCGFSHAENDLCESRKKEEEIKEEEAKEEW